MNVKRVLSLLLAMAMVFSMMPISVLAAEEIPAEEPAAIVEEQVEETKEEVEEETAEEPEEEVEEPAEEPTVEETATTEPVVEEPVVEEPVVETTDEPATEESVVEDNSTQATEDTETVVEPVATEGEGNETQANGAEGEATQNTVLVTDGETVAKAAGMMMFARKPGSKPNPNPNQGEEKKTCGHPLKLGNEYEDPENISCELVLKGNDKDKHYDAVLTGYITVVCEKCGKENDNIKATATVKNNNDKKIEFDIIEENGEKVLNNQSDVEGYAKEKKLWKLVGNPKCGEGQENKEPEVTTTNLEDIALKLVVDGENMTETGLTENEFKYGFDIPSIVNPEKNEGMVFVSVDADAYYIEKIVVGGKSFNEDNAISGIEFGDDQCDIDVWGLCEDEDNGINEIKSITAYIKTKQTAEGFAASIIDKLPDTVKFFSYENENEEYETGYKTKRNGTAGYTDVNGIDAAVKVDSEIIKDILVQFYEDTEANYTGKKSDWADYIKKAWTSNNENGININEDDLGALLDIDAESMGKFNEYEWYILKKHCDVNAWHMDGVAKPKFSVKYVAEGVDFEESQRYVEGTIITLTEKTPTKESDEFASYEFAGWSTTEGGEVEYAAGAAFEIPENDVTLYAVFNVYRTVKYVVDGEAFGDTETYLDGTIVTVTDKTPSKAKNELISYEFAGWSTTEGGKVEYAAGSTFELTENVTLYAVFDVYRTVYFSVRAGKEMKDAEGNMIAPYMAPAELESTEKANDYPAPGLYSARNNSKHQAKVNNEIIKKIGRSTTNVDLDWFEDIKFETINLEGIEIPFDEINWYVFKRPNNADKPNTQWHVNGTVNQYDVSFEIGENVITNAADLVDTRVIWGKTVEFKADLNDTYYKDIVVKANGTVIDAVEGKYSVEVKADTVIEITASEIFYGVTFEGENFTAEGDYTAIKPNENATFTVKANDGYRVASVKLGNNELIADENGVYTVNMDSDKTVTVETVKVWKVTTKAIGGSIEAPATVDDGATLVFKVAADKHNNLVKVTVNGNEVQPSDKVYKVENVTGDVEIIAEFNLTATVYVRKDGGRTDEITSKTKKKDHPDAEYSKIGTATISGKLFEEVINWTSIANDDFVELFENNSGDIVYDVNDTENGYTYYVIKKYPNNGWHIDAVSNYAVTVDPESFGTVITVNGEELAVDEKVVVPAGTVVEFEVTPNGKNVFVDEVTVKESPVAADSDDIYTITVDENKVIKTTAKVKADFYLTTTGEKMEEVTTTNVKERKNYDAELYSAKGEYGSGYVKGELAKKLLKDGYVSIEVDKSPDIECDNEVAVLKPWYVVKNISDGRWHVDGAIQNTVTYTVKNNGFEAAPEAPAVAKVSYNGSHTIDTEYGADDVVTEDGTWSFGGWKFKDTGFYADVTTIDNITSNVELVGEWTFTAKPVEPTPNPEPQPEPTPDPEPTPEPQPNPTPAPVNPTPAPGGDDDDDSSGGGSGGGGGRVVWENSDNDIVTFDDEEVPLAAAPMMMTILDEEVPLGFLPQTGGSAQFLPATCAVEADLRVREEEEE